MTLRGTISILNIVIVIILHISLSFSENYSPSLSYEEDDYVLGDYGTKQNDTEDYESITGRNEAFFGEARPAYPLNHYLPNKDHLHELTELLNYHHIHKKKPGLLKKKKYLKKKQYRSLLPLLLTALAKVAHFLPVVKLTLLALFALVLFSKKALLVSLGSLILVLYDTFYKGKHNTNVGVSIVKERGSTVPTVEHEIHSDEHGIDTLDEPWHGRREEKIPPKINPRGEDTEYSKKWKRWWAPQINFRRKIMDSSSDSREINQDELIYENLEDIINNLSK